MLPGTTINSDCWAAYNWIIQLDRRYNHRTVNHSLTFVAPDGTHTNRDYFVAFGDANDIFNNYLFVFKHQSGWDFCLFKIVFFEGNKDKISDKYLCEKREYYWISIYIFCIMVYCKKGVFREIRPSWSVAHLKVVCKHPFEGCFYLIKIRYTLKKGWFTLFWRVYEGWIHPFRVDFGSTITLKPIFFKNSKIDA